MYKRSLSINTVGATAIFLMGGAVWSAAATTSPATRSTQTISNLQAQALAGDRDAMQTLGSRYLLGDGVKKDVDLGYFWTRSAADHGQAAAMRNTAVCFLNGVGVPKNAEQGAAWMRLAADSGHAQAMFEYGQLYERGTGLAVDGGSAMVWMHRAATAGHMPAMRALADRYASERTIGGRTFMKQLDSALTWRTRAAEAGDAESMYRLFVHFETDGPAKNERDATMWCLRAADAGNGPAMTQVGQWYERGERGLLQDQPSAIQWYEKAAAAGHPHGQMLLAYRYKEGKGVPRDVEKAMSLFREAADRGHPNSMVALAIIYRYGDYGSQDMVAAATWYRKAADAKYPLAISALGEMYENGYGVGRDLAKAADLYEDAAKYGYAPAMIHLADLYDAGRGVPKNPTKAATLLESAALTRDAKGMYRYGLYLVGLPTKQDETNPHLWTGLTWLARAEEAGNKDAAEMVAELCRKMDKGEPGGFLDGVTAYFSVPHRGDNNPEYRQQHAELAREWLERRAKAGSGAAMLWYAQHYERGELFPKDLGKARDWYRQSARHGVKDAMKRCRELGIDWR